MTHEEMFADSPIKIGQKYKFDYPVEFTSLDDYSAHRGAVVNVIEPMPASEADVLWDDPEGNGTEVIVDRMFRVRDEADGWVGCAWESELVEL